MEKSNTNKSIEERINRLKIHRALIRDEEITTKNKSQLDDEAIALILSVA